MKKLILSTLAICLAVLCFVLLPQEAQAAEPAIIASGTCGENLTWTLDDQGLLTISGTGAMTDWTGDSYAPWYGKRGSIQKVTIEDGVTTIGASAFEYCRSLTSVTIPDNVTTIGEYAFFYCTSLASITIPDRVTTIGDYAFSYCDKLQSVTIGNSVTTIGEQAFYYCRSLTSVTIGNSVTTIGDYAFSSCTSLTSINIPNSVTAIGDSAFRYCHSLTGIWVDANNPNYSSDKYGALFNKNKNELIQAPRIYGSYTIPDSVTTIGDYAFEDCRSLTSVTIGNSVTTIGERAFCGCSSLTSINIPNSVTAIGDSAFRACSKLQSVTIGNNVTAIGDYAFCACSKLQSVTIGNNVTTIGDYAFSSCTSLTSINIPNSVTTIGDSAFYYCSSLTSITIPDSVTTIGNYVLSSCTSLTSITIPDSVTTIGAGAFEDCTSLTSINIPDSVTTIGDSAFASCDSLTSINIPDSVTTIGDSAFFSCDSLASITIPDSVTTIGAGAFEDCTSLTSINIPDSVTTIGISSFYYCSNLTSINIPDGVTTIGEYAFYYCSSLTSINIPGSVTTIGDSAFENCTSLTSIAFKGNAPEFGDYVFYDVTATAYYPANNATWTEAVRQDYGGNITWVAVEQEAHTVTWVQATTSLEGNIGLNFYVKLSDSLVNDPTTAMRFIFNGVTMDVPLSQAVKSGDQYKFTCPVSAKNMADTVNAQIVTADGPVGDAKNLAVMTYCNYMISNSKDTKLVSLMKAMLNYGAAAQILFDHNTDNLANASLSEADRQLADVDASAYAHSVTGSEDGIQVYNATLLLETETSIRIYFKLTGSKTIDQYTFMVDGKVVQAKPNGSQYYVEIPNIAAQHLDEMHTVTVGGLTIRYGGLSYVNQVIQNPQYATEAMTDAAKALFAYNKMAEDYFN